MRKKNSMARSKSHRTARLRGLSLHRWDFMVAGQAYPGASMRSAESKLRGPLPWECTAVIFPGATLREEGPPALP